MGKADLEWIFQNYNNQLYLLFDFVNKSHQSLEEDASVALTTDCPDTNEALKETSKKLLRAISNDEKIVELDSQYSREILSALKAFKMSSSTRNILHEMVLSQIATLQEAMFKDCLEHIYISFPKTLMSKEKVSISDVLKHSHMADFIESHAKEEVQKLRGGIDSIQKIYNDKFNIDLTEFDDWYNIIELTYRRNLFIHNKGIINRDYFKAFTNAKKKSKKHMNAVFSSSRTDLKTTENMLEIDSFISMNDKYILDGINTLYNLNHFVREQILNKFYK
ncbi:hypothetical protein HHE92_06655 [Pseudoalteromonas arctica]|uniref:hypothetical protein n=1 Tax=Pseudoalteromonas arctica TaxID=394751 RepID=UPI00145C25D1|nr:hypothetical protein [Pseudoalteromonas arctica]NMP79477.1 hypothetical protein [Pseudoalteromonas arctica]